MTFIVDGTSGLTFPDTSVQASAGKVLQVVQANTTTNVSTTSTSYSDTTLTATITPKFSTSKILVMVSQGGVFRSSSSSSLSVMIKTLRNSTSIVDYTYEMYSSSSFQFKYSSLSFNYLDSPSTTSATTYKTQVASSTSGQTVSVQQDSDLSTIVLMEIAT